MTLGEGLTDDFFRTAEPIGRGGIDEINAVLDRRSDRGNRFRFLGSTPHPAADGPGAQGNARYFERSADDGGTLNLDFAGFSFTSHGLAPSSPRAASDFSACSRVSPQARWINAAHTRVADLSVRQLAYALVVHLSGPRSACS